MLVMLFPHNNYYDFILFLIDFQLPAAEQQMKTRETSDLGENKEQQEKEKMRLIQRSSNL